MRTYASQPPQIEITPSPASTPPSLQRLRGSDAETAPSTGVADHSQQVTGRHHILVINGSRYTLIPLTPNGKTLYFFYGYAPGSASDQAMLEEEAPFLEDDVIYAAEQGFYVVYDLAGTRADFAEAIFNPQTYGIYWGGHGDGRGNIHTSDGALIGPGSIQGGIDAGRQVSPNLRYFILAACNSGRIAEEWQSVLPDQCQFQGWVNITTTAESIDFTSTAAIGDSLVSHGGIDPTREMRDYIDQVSSSTEE